MQEKLERLDDQVGRAIQSGTKKCRKIRNGAIPFSKGFGIVRDEHRLWILVIRRKYGRRISSTTIRRLASKLKIGSPLGVDFTEVKYRIKLATQRYIEFIKNAKTERDTFNESLANANARANNKPKERILRKIKHDEEERIHNTKTKTIYKKAKFQRLDRVVIIHNDQPLEVTDPHRVEEALREMNKSKYSSTNETPMMGEPYLSEVGYLAEKSGAEQILEGTFGFPLDTPNTERELISRLCHPGGILPISTTVTQQEYKDAWRSVKKRKSSSMSGRHFGVYEAVTNDDRLLPVFTNLFNLPFITGTLYNRWSGFFNVMTMKEENNYNVDKLRSLILGEADWNMGGRIFVNRRMFRGAESHQLIPHEHYGGRKNMKAIDAVLNKRLALDNIRLQKRPAAILSSDAANFYDRMVHSFISLSVQRLGLPLSIILALLRPLQECRHFTRTAYGDTSQFYGGKQDIPFQGSGQENASSSPFWAVVSSHLIDMMREMNVCSTFTAAITLVTFALVMIMYVDDNDIFITSDRINQIEDIRHKAQQAITFWKEVLHVTGVVVRPSKCSWVLLDFSWNGSKYRYKRISEVPGTLELGDENGNRLCLRRNEPTTSLEGLGVFLQPAGSDADQFMYLSQKITRWLGQVQLSTLPASLNFNALHTRILRTIHYPLVTTCFSKEQCHRLEIQLYSKTLPRCGVSSKMPLAIRYSPRRFMGLAIPEIHVHQGIQHTYELLSSYESKNTTSQQLQVSLELIHLLLGTQRWIFDQIDHDLIHMMDGTWIQNTWDFLLSHHYEIKAYAPSFCQPRLHDSFIMEDINELQIPNMEKCR